MDESMRTKLQMFDRVCMLEPQLRDALKAARTTAKNAIDQCFLNYSWKSNTYLTDRREHEVWIAAQKVFTSFEGELVTACRELDDIQRQNTENAKAQARNYRALDEAQAEFLRSLSVEATLQAQIETYIKSRLALHDYNDVRAADHTARPAYPSPEVFDAVLPLLAKDLTEKSKACRAESEALAARQRELAGAGDSQRTHLGTLVARLDTVGAKLDQANLTAAKAARSLVRQYRRQDRYMASIGDSAVETCEAVIKLSRRVDVVKAHPTTAGDVSR